MNDGLNENRLADQPMRLLAAAVESSSDAIITKDLEGHILSWNAAAEALYGYGRREVLGKPVALIEPPDRRGETEHILESIRKGEGVSRFETVRLRKDGNPVEISLNVSPVLDANGEVFAASSIAHDISEKKRMEAALRVSEERFRLLTEHIESVFWISAPGADPMFYVSPAFERLWARGRDELISNPATLRDTIHPDDRLTYEAALDQHAKGRTYDAEYRIMLPDGTVRWIRDRGFPVPDEHGHSRLMTGLAMDITELKRIQEDLDRRQQEFATLVENAPDMIIRFDTAMRVVYVNPAAEEYLGKSRDEVIGRSLEEIELTREEAANWKHSVGSVLETGRILSEPHYVWGPEGKRYFEAHLSPECRTGKTVDTVLAVIRDLTPLKRNEEALQRRTDELQRLNAELDEFTSIASHDLKAPLRAVANLAAWVDEDAGDRLDEENRDRLRLVQERVARMSRLIDGLLAFARTGRINAEASERVSLSPLLMELLNELPVPQGFRIDLDESLPTLQADPLHLRQIFQNLITNAFTHHDQPQKGHLRIAAIEETNRWIIEIADDGPGIPIHERGIVFKMFAKGPAPTGDHTGVGLAVVKKLVVSYGGQIEVDDNQPRGALFRIYWPK